MGGRAGSMCVVLPRNDPPLRRNEGMQRAKWTRPEVVIEYFSACDAADQLHPSVGKPHGGRFGGRECRL
eukprot:3294071-Lingulodinium_polyedra.AAC.1